MLLDLMLVLKLQRQTSFKAIYGLIDDAAIILSSSEVLRFPYSL